MPVHIVPQLRRPFLTTTSLFAGSLVVNQFESVKESDTWALLSDTHIDADRTVAAHGGSIIAQNLETVVDRQLGADQLAWLEKELALPIAKPAVNFMHHNPQLPAPAEPDKEVSEITGLPDAQASYDIMDKFPITKANLWGHTYCWMVQPGKSGDYHRIALPALGCAFSSNDPLGSVPATFTTDDISMKLLCLDTQDPRHHESHQLAWR